MKVLSLSIGFLSQNTGDGMEILPDSFQGMSCLKFLEDEEGKHCSNNRITGTSYSQNSLLDKFGRVREAHLDHEVKH